MRNSLLTRVLPALIGLAGGATAHAEAINGTPPLCDGPTQWGETRVYTGTNLTGTCYVLKRAAGSTEDWASWDATTGFPNDAIRSILTTSATLVLFWNSFYAADNGATFTLEGGFYVSDLGSWNGKASAARVQNFPANKCGNLANQQRLVLFTDDDFRGDCTQLNTGFKCYPNGVAMGFRENTLTSLVNSNVPISPGLYTHEHYGGFELAVPPNASIRNIGLSPYFWNDVTASVTGSTGLTSVCRTF